MRAASLAMIVMLTMVGGLLEDSPYCAVRYRRLCQGKGVHVGCQFPEPGPGASCEKYSAIKFQDNLKNFITHYINRRRQRIASGTERVRGGMHLPKPQVMMMVEWDRELATLAQRLADQCEFVHDDCRATVRYPYAGQTVGEVRWRRSSDSDVITAKRAIRRVFDAWWGERRRVQPTQLTAPFRLTAKGAVWGHFSQLAVWSLRAVGCGAVRHGAEHPRLLLVCDFSHTNMLGQRTITPGPPAPCPLHTERRLRSPYPLLCAQVRYPNPKDHYETETEADESDDYSCEEDEETTNLATFQYIRNFTERPLHRTYDPATYANKPSRITNWMTSNGYQALHLLHQTRSENALISKLGHELEMRRKVASKVILADHKWRHRIAADNKRLGFVKPREEEEANTENVLVVIPTLNDTEKYMGRHRWHTRDRPRRPGATALFRIESTMSSRPSSGSITLDKEDIAQLFRDTGFNPSWVRNPPPSPKENQ